MRNLELKFRVEDFEPIQTRAKALGASMVEVLLQEDTFFPASEGRLKLRTFADGTGELIAYRRADSTAARESDYRLFKVMDPEALSGVLSFGLGAIGTVRKRRQLYLWQHTRIHLDEVEGLGKFTELETVISDQSEDAAEQELLHVVEALGLPDQNRIARAYVDLLLDGASR